MIALSAIDMGWQFVAVLAALGFRDVVYAGIRWRRKRAAG